MRKQHLIALALILILPMIAIPLEADEGTILLEGNSCYSWELSMEKGEWVTFTLESMNGVAFDWCLTTQAEYWDESIALEDTFYELSYKFAQWVLREIEFAWCAPYTDDYALAVWNKGSSDLILDFKLDFDTSEPTIETKYIFTTETITETANITITETQECEKTMQEFGVPILTVCILFIALLTLYQRRKNK